MKKEVILLALIILSTTVASQTDDDIFYSDYLMLDLVLDSGFELTGGSQSSVQSAKASFAFFPEDNLNQEVYSTNTRPNADKVDDNLVFIWESPELGNYHYEIDSRVKTFNKIKQVKKKVNFPMVIDDPTLIKYLQKTEKIDINEDIIKQASMLARGEDDLYKVVYNLASWTRQNINYSLTTVTSQASQKASWVLKNRYGVCDELTNLFIAMSRSLGIPARFVSGISYTNSDQFSEPWGLHGWAEIYFPEHGWISFDPTYGQYGYLDAGHIKLKDSIDSDKSSTKFEWHGYSVDLEPDLLNIEVYVDDIGTKNPNIIQITPEPFLNEVGFDSYNVIEAKLENKKNYYVGMELILAKSTEIEIIDDRKKFVILEPYEKKSVFWIVKVNDNLKEKYIYTFPMEIINSLGYSEPLTFKSSSTAVDYQYSQATALINNLKEEESKVYSKNVDIDCNVDSFVYSNIPFEVNCQIKNLGNTYLEKVSVCIEGICKNIDLGITQTKDLNYNLMSKNIGETKLAVIAKSNDISKTYTIDLIVNDEPSLNISKINHPLEVKYGPEFDVSFEVEKSSFSTPKNVKVKFIFNTKETAWDFDEIDSSQKFNINLDKSMLNPDTNYFTIIVEYFDSNNKKFISSQDGEFKTNSSDFITKFLMWINKLGRNIEEMFNQSQGKV